MQKPLRFVFCTIVCSNQELIGQWIDFYSQFGDCYVVEGATSDWKKALGWKGHNSTDGTVEIIRASGVPHTIAKRPWKDKTEQCNEFMRNIPPDTDILWYCDSDEFYLPEDIEFVRGHLEQAVEPITFGSVFMHHWWKHPDYYCIGGDGWAYDTPIPRIWKHRPGAVFSSHRPPTIMQDGRDLANVNPWLAKDNPIRCRHYSYCFRQQVIDKLKYYSAIFGRDYMKWFREVWEPWNPETRDSIERQFSVHPSCKGATTLHFPSLQHPIEVPWE